MSDSNTTPISSPRRVLVTGAAKGIGVGIARAFAHHGDRILIHFRSNPDAAQRLADELRPHAAEVVLHQADLADLDQLDQLFAHVRSLWGGLDVAVNNAGWDPGFVPSTTSPQTSTGNSPTSTSAAPSSAASAKSNSCASITSAVPSSTSAPSPV